MSLHPVFRTFIAAAILTLNLCVIAGLTGCGPSDEERISNALSAEFDQVKNPDGAYLSALLDDNAKQQITDAGIEVEPFIAAFLNGFDYQINSIEVDKDTATAQITITAKSLSDITSAMQDEAQESAEAGTGSNLTEEQIQQQIAEQTLEYVQNAQPREKPPITVTLKRTDKVWVIDQQTRSALEQALL